MSFSCFANSSKKETYQKYKQEVLIKFSESNFERYSNRIQPDTIDNIIKNELAIIINKFESFAKEKKGFVFFDPIINYEIVENIDSYQEKLVEAKQISFCVPIITGVKPIYLKGENQFILQEIENTLNSYISKIEKSSFCLASDKANFKNEIFKNLRNYLTRSSFDYNKLKACNSFVLFKFNKQLTKVIVSNKITGKSYCMVKKNNVWENDFSYLYQFLCKYYCFNYHKIAEGKFDYKRIQACSSNYKKIYNRKVLEQLAKLNTEQKPKDKLETEIANIVRDIELFNDSDKYAFINPWIEYRIVQNLNTKNEIKLKEDFINFNFPIHTKAIPIYVNKEIATFMRKLENRLSMISGDGWFFESYAWCLAQRIYDIDTSPFYKYIKSLVNPLCLYATKCGVRIGYANGIQYIKFNQQFNKANVCDRLRGLNLNIEKKDNKWHIVEEFDNEKIISKRELNLCSISSSTKSYIIDYKQLFSKTSFNNLSNSVLADKASTPIEKILTQIVNDMEQFVHTDKIVFFDPNFEVSIQDENGKIIEKNKLKFKVPIYSNAKVVYINKQIKKELSNLAYFMNKERGFGWFFPYNKEITFVSDDLKYFSPFHKYIRNFIYEASFFYDEPNFGVKACNGIHEVILNSSLDKAKIIDEARHVIYNIFKKNNQWVIDETIGKIIEFQ